ncbi:MAG: glycosyltransferase family 2 protein, partial [Muribaculaceae bacterium]|nr:glycosyltransferase family 2 protein [Muribaculaceae bacterium]
MLGVVIVAYKNPERTADYVKNQLSRLTDPYVVVVVNNASTFEECQRLAELCSGTACKPEDEIGPKKVYVVHSVENLGFAKGNNLGVKVLKRNNPCEYLLFSNDDIILKDPTDLRPMIDLLKDDSSIGAIGPDVVGLDGHHQSPHRRVITAYRQIGWSLLKTFRRKRLAAPSNGENPAPTEGPCYWVSGAFFLMSYADFEAVGGFDPDTFLYMEEAILAERLMTLGKHMYYYPGVQVDHLAGGTIKNTFQNKFIRQMVTESNAIYYRQYLKTPAIVVALYKFLE